MEKVKEEERVGNSLKKPVILANLSTCHPEGVRESFKDFKQGRVILIFEL